MVLKPQKSVPHLLLLGAGYVGEALARVLIEHGWRVTGTTRNPQRAEQLKAAGITPCVGDDLSVMFSSPIQATHWLISAAPTDDGQDPFLRFAAALAGLGCPSWCGYLSSTSVYGDTQGAWVDEDATVAPTAVRGQRRVLAEQAWLDWGRRNAVDTHVFRLGGIYGPGRSALDRVREGRAQVISKPDKVFNRIHVEDIVQVLRASFARPRAGATYNVVDGKPLPPESATVQAYQLLERPVPEALPWDGPDIRPSVRAFYEGNVRVRSRRLSDELGVKLKHPDAVVGLHALFEQESK